MMKRVIRLTERDLTKIVKRVITEQTDQSEEYINKVGNEVFKKLSGERICLDYEKENYSSDTFQCFNLTSFWFGDAIWNNKKDPKGPEKISLWFNAYFYSDTKTKKNVSINFSFSTSYGKITGISDWGQYVTIDDKAYNFDVKDVTSKISKKITGIKFDGYLPDDKLMVDINKSLTKNGFSFKKESYNIGKWKGVYKGNTFDITYNNTGNEITTSGGSMKNSILFCVHSPKPKGDCDLLFKLFSISNFSVEKLNLILNSPGEAKEIEQTKNTTSGWNRGTDPDGYWKVLFDQLKKAGVGVKWEVPNDPVKSTFMYWGMWVIWKDLNKNGGYPVVYKDPTTKKLSAEKFDPYGTNANPNSFKYIGQPADKIYLRSKGDTEPRKWFQ